MGPALSIAGAGAITAIAQIARGEWPSARLIAGVGIAGAALLMVASKSPELASAFGTLVLVTALMVSGVDLAKAAGNALNL